MAYRKRPSPTITEIEQKLEPAIDLYFSGIDLTIKEDFEVAWDKYFEGNDLMQNSVRTRNETYARHLFKKAGGKNIEQDRRTRAKETVSTPSEFIKRGSRRVDLPNVDTPFRNIATRKGKTVIAKEFKIFRRGKTIKILRDKKGRFVKRQ